MSTNFIADDGTARGNLGVIVECSKPTGSRAGWQCAMRPGRNVLDVPGVAVRSFYWSEDFKCGICGAAFGMVAVCLSNHLCCIVAVVVGLVGVLIDNVGSAEGTHDVLRISSTNIPIVGIATKDCHDHVVGGTVIVDNILET